MSETSSALLVGATSQVGLHVLPALLDKRTSLIALSRRVGSSKTIKHHSGASLDWYHPDLFKSLISRQKPELTPEALAPGFLISAGPIKLALEWLELCSSLQSVICVSTSSVFSKADSGNDGERNQIEEILRAEEQLISRCSKRNLDLIILRPTLIYGCGMDENISRMVRFIKRFGFLPLAGEASGLRQPIHVADLAGLIAQLSSAEISGQNAFQVAGGSTLSYREMAVRVFQGLGKPERIIGLSPGLLAAAVSIASKLPGMNGLNSQMVERQNQDLVFDDHEVRQRFNFSPRTFQPGPEDFVLPFELKQLLPDKLRGS